MKIRNYILRNSISQNDCHLDCSNIFNLTKKYTKPNIWYSDTGYGLIDIYKDYAGLNNNYKSKINTLHGTFMGMNDNWWYNSEASFKSVPAMFVHYETNKSFLEKIFNNSKKFVLAQHPYHIILKNYEEDVINERVGSVLFLPHTLGLGKPLNISFLIEVLNKLPNNYHPVKVCIHPNDINSIAINELTAANFKIVCCGSRYDPLFLHRFFWICNGVKNCLSIDFSTHTILSSLSGLKIVSLLKMVPTMQWVHGNYVLPNICPDKEYWPLLDEYFSDNINQDRFQKAARIVTGGDIESSPKDIYDVFKSTEKLAKSRIDTNNRFKFSCNDWNCIEFYIIKLKAYFKAVQNRLSGNNKLIQPVSPRINFDLYRYNKTFSFNES